MKTTYPWLRVETTLPLPVLIGLVLFIGCTAFFVSDMYVPSLPNIMQVFDASRNQVQWTITAYLLGLALPQLIYGPVSDRYGRRPVIIFGLAITLAASVMCVFAHSITQLIIGRLLQGIGVSAALSLSRSMFRDMFEGERLARMGSYMAMLFAVGPAIAPVLGGYFEHWYGWRGAFAFMLVYVMSGFLLTYFVLPETNQQKNAKALRPMVLISNYKKIAFDAVFQRNTLATCVCISGILVFYTMSPFILQTVLGLSPVNFGLTTLALTSMAIISRSINALLLGRIQSSNLIRIGLSAMVVSSLIMLLIGLCGVLTVSAVVMPMMGFIMGTGLVFPNAFAAALTPFPRIAGSAGALYGTLQTFGTFVLTAIAACFHVRNQEMLAVILLVTSIVALTVYCLGERAPH